MKKFLNTTAIFIAKLLNLTPTSWAASKLQADTMSANAAAHGVTAVEIDGQMENSVAPQSPLGYLGEAVCGALGMVVAIWIVMQLLFGFWVILPYLVVLAIVLWALGKFQPKGQLAAS